MTKLDPDQPDHWLTASMITGDARDCYSREFPFIVFIDAHFPPEWRTSVRTARNVLAVVESYLALQPGHSDERFEQACIEAATAMGKRETTVRKSCGQRLYEQAIGCTYTDLFHKDLKEFEDDWVKFQTT